MAGSINIKEIIKVQNQYPKYKNIKCFVETGTYKGGTIFPMSSFFERLYTIELLEKNYLDALKKNETILNKNIKFYQGDSKLILPEIIKEINEPALFYLDGHFCGKESAFGSFPLFEELNAINVRNYNDLIIIDDYRIFGTKKKNLDWSMVTNDNLLKCLNQNKIVKTFVNNDRFYILLEGTK